MLKWSIFGAPSDFEGCRNGPWNFHFRQKHLKNRTSPNEGDPPGADPAFPQTIVITVPLGLTALQNVIFSMKICYFPVFLAFRCALFS